MKAVFDKSNNSLLALHGKTPKKFLVYAGRISSEKGLQELIDSFCKVAPKDFLLKIIGTGPILNVLKEQTNTNVEFLGSIPNQEVINQISDAKGVVTATKLLEGQPTILCEASSFGIPSIYPRSGGIEEFFPKSNTNSSISNSSIVKPIFFTSASIV